MGVTFIAPAEQFTSPAKLITKEITEDGTYYAADDNANGYSSVEVSVGGGGGGGLPDNCTITFTNNHRSNTVIVSYVTTDVSKLKPVRTSSYAVGSEHTINVSKESYLTTSIESSMNTTTTGGVQRYDSTTFIITDSGSIDFK